MIIILFHFFLIFLFYFLLTIRFSVRFMELCSDEQREKIVAKASQSLIQVSLDMHGTRAAQKLIEHLSSRSQFETVIKALR